MNAKQTLLLFLSFVFLSNCATKDSSEHRQLPAKILSCSEVINKTISRNKLFSEVKGSGHFVADKKSFNIDLAIKDNDFFFQINGPLGIPGAIIQKNSKWFYLYISPQKRLFRIPASEVMTNSARYKRFKKLLPISDKIDFISFIKFIKTQSPIPSNRNQCKFDIKSMTYTFAENYGLLRIDPNYYFPVKSIDSTGNLVSLNVAKQYQNTKYPSKILFKFFNNKESEINFKWHKLILGPVDKEIFNWQPPKVSSVKIIDF